MSTYAFVSVWPWTSWIVTPKDTVKGNCVLCTGWNSTVILLISTGVCVHFLGLYIAQTHGSSQRTCTHVGISTSVRWVAFYQVISVVVPCQPFTKPSVAIMLRNSITLEPLYSRNVLGSPAQSESFLVMFGISGSSTAIIVLAVSLRKSSVHMSCNCLHDSRIGYVYAVLCSQWCVLSFPVITVYPPSYPVTVVFCWVFVCRWCLFLPWNRLLRKAQFTTVSIKSSSVFDC